MQVRARRAKSFGLISCSGVGSSEVERRIALADRAAETSASRRTVALRACAVGRVGLPLAAQLPLRTRTGNRAAQTPPASRLIDSCVRVCSLSTRELVSGERPLPATSRLCCSLVTINWIIDATAIAAAASMSPPQNRHVCFIPGCSALSNQKRRSRMDNKIQSSASRACVRQATHARTHRQQ